MEVFSGKIMGKPPMNEDLTGRIIELMGDFPAHV